MIRPDPSREPPAGFRWVPFAEEVEHWRLLPSLPPGTRRCRFTVGPGHRACGCDAVAELFRKHYVGRRPGTWWAYCADHLYGRWIEDDQVMAWRLEEVKG